jgi:hypothetical protein
MGKEDLNFLENDVQNKILIAACPPSLSYGGAGKDQLKKNTITWLIFSLFCY